MSNALRFMQCLPFGRQSKFYQPPLNYTSIGSRVLSLFAAVSMLLASLLGFSAVAVAEEEAVIEEVVVTGSRIKRTDFDTGGQLYSLDRVEIDAVGVQTIADVLRSSPLNIYGSFNERSGSSAQSNANFDLRGMGSDRTLVLVNGRRMTGSPAQGAATININMLPMTAVERLDIMADGGSAVYGSDAVAGVVNLQLREDFEGLEFQISGGNRKEDSGTEESFSLIAGTDNGRTSITFVAEYSKRSAIFDADRDYTAPWIVDDGDGRTDIYNDTDGISHYGKTIQLSDRNTDYYDIQAANNCPTGDGFYGVMGALAFGEPDGTVCAYGYAEVSANKAALDKLSTYGSLSHVISDKVEFFATALVSQVESFGRYAPPAAAWNDMPADYRDVPYDIDALIADGTITDEYELKGYYRWTSIGTRDGEVTDWLYDFVAGFRGDFSDEINYEVYMQRSTYDSKDLGKYFLSYPGLDYVLNEGLDPFSPEGAGAMSALPIQDNRTSMQKTYGHVQFNVGDLFGAGENVALVGSEIISLDYVNEYDRASENGFVGGSAGNSSAGDRDITALFAEMLMPVHEKVEVNAALRYDDYSDFGSNVSPSLSAIFDVTRDISVRARWSLGFRAPALDELYGPETFSAEDATDYATCSENGIAVTDCPSRQFDTYYRTNDSLDAEESQTFSIGGNWLVNEYLELDLGYWLVEVDDVIQQSDTQDVLYAEAAGIDLDPNSGTYIDRTGALPVIYSSHINEGELNVDGLDLRISGLLETDGFGSFGGDFLWSHSLKYEQAAFYQGPIQETKGFFLQPEDRMQAVLRWDFKQHNVTLVVDYIGPHSEADFVEVGDDGVATLETSSKELDSWTTLNLSYSYDAGRLGAIKVGARNLTNEDPVLDRNDKFERDLYDLYDNTGQVFYFQYKLVVD